MPAGVPKEAVDYYVDLLKKVRAHAGMGAAHERRRLQPVVHDRRRLRQMGRNEDKRHNDLMKEAGFLHSN
jgi:tripartite-type tricarboxylate transporter receptor subunit TctC